MSFVCEDTSVSTSTGRNHNSSVDLSVVPVDDDTNVEDYRIHVPNMIAQDEMQFLKCMEKIDSYDFEVFEIKNLTNGIYCLLLLIFLLL